MSPTIFREGGYRFFFFSREEERRHVHVLGPDGEAKFWLEPEIALAKNHRLTDPQLVRIRKIVEEHKDELIRAWDSHFGT
ncbi:MAG: DUF4160 domain-containing protein [Pseudohongiellaceae bacterium]